VTAAGALTAALALLLVPSGAHAAFRGSNGRIAITSEWGCDGAWTQTVRPDGSGLRPLGAEPCDEQAPQVRYAAWRADGRELLVNSWTPTEAGADTAVATIDADGTSLRSLPLPYGTHPRPAFYRHRLVYERPGSANGRSDIWLANYNGSEARRLTAGSHPRFSPNARRIAFVGPVIDRAGRPSSARQGLWLMKASGEIIRRVTRADVSELDWSPDGKRLTYVTRKPTRDTPNDLYTIDVRGKQRRRLTTTRRMDEFSPAWSPDGSWIAFVRRIPGSHEQDSPTYQVRKRRPEGGRSRLILQLPDVFDPVNGAFHPTTLSWQPLAVPD
jgi:WD40-like Beta Propeller Repeat